MSPKIAFFFLFLITVNYQLSAQEFTRLDSLRGSITPEREWWDLSHYDLNVKVEPDKKYISGTNTVTYKVLKPYQTIQIDLQQPMQLLSATQDGVKLTYKKEGSAYFISLKAKQEKGDVKSLKLTFEGTPRVAVNPPWDGGWTWKNDSKGQVFAANSNEGIGPSIWWPNKDHPYDEVDSLVVEATVPKGLMAVSNGKLIDSTNQTDTSTFHWAVKNPINSYGVNINIADYAHFSDTFEGEKGDLALNYYVLKENLEKAKKQFKQVPKMLKAFEYWFGPYPFYEDGYKLVEVPYLGMEHQSSVTYGNHYENGYLGSDLSGTGWGLKFDFIIIHESGHEWFANNITDSDVADMWIHEGFTAYSENLFIDYYYGKEAASEYVRGTRAIISNDRPIIGKYGVDYEGSGDMYYKGANMLHTLRQLIDDDEKWRSILRGLNKTFYHQTVSTKQIEDYISKESGIDLSQFFDQYLRTIKIPLLEFKVEGKNLVFRYSEIVPDFDMPLRVTINGKSDWIYPEAEWKTKKMDSNIINIEIDPDFYINSKKVK
ncbi:MAG: M1 family metallopeptidase [Leeuwenhoekiella sp.]